MILINSNGKEEGLRNNNHEELYTSLVLNTHSKMAAIAEQNQLQGPVYTVRKTASVQVHFQLISNRNWVRSAYCLTSKQAASWLN